MKELVILSGKGGTGKTSLTGAFAALAQNHCLCDADVDAADLHLLLAPELQQRTDFIGGSKASIREADCSQCGTCAELCQFDAITPQFTIDQLNCEGCGVCVEFCPEQAVDFSPNKCGEWFLSQTRFGPLAHARLGIGEENSGRLVSLVRSQAKKLAGSRDLELIITDGPPGIGCPVIASITGATAVAIIVEPTLSGIHDMQRVADLLTHFKIPGLICINKCDLNQGLTAAIEVEGRKRGMEIIGRLPFDPRFTRAMVAAQTIVEFAPGSRLVENIRDIWTNICTSKGLNRTSADFSLPLLNS
jgi:MinD superfamily P-loop ATPase